MGVADALVPIEIHNREAAKRETFGHLAPRKHYTYKGRFTYAVGCIGNADINPTCLFFKFGRLQSSPWFYDSLTDLMDQLREGGYGEPGCVYEWIGTFRNYKWEGEVSLLNDTNKE